uniref:Uncharacterized protein n=1 Tax=Romanomermis culicivorax TaxID=13658 RepID=A0A915KPW7_ROMCU
MDYTPLAPKAISKASTICIRKCGRNASLDGSTSTQVPPSSTIAPPPNLGAQPVPGKVSDTATTKDASTPAISQILLPLNAGQPEIDPNIYCADSTEFFINLDPALALATTIAPAWDHRSSLAIANANKVQNFRLEACDALVQLNMAIARIINNVPTVQTIDQIIGAISNQFQA